MRKFSGYGKDEEYHEMNITQVIKLEKVKKFISFSLCI